jgi:hypothetical protein
MTLVNGWASEQNVYGTGDPSYCLETDGMVYLSGSIAAPSGTPASSTFATLPAAEWPAHEIYLDVYTKNGTHGILRIDPSGTMEAYGGSANGFTSLAGVSFPAAGVSQTGAMTLSSGWQSAQGTYNTGDPAYYISNGIVHLSGSLQRPAGPPVAGTGEDFLSGALPSQAAPSDTCFAALTYAYGGSMQQPGINLYGSVSSVEDNRYTSLAGINYPGPGTSWQPLTQLAGRAAYPWYNCNYAVAYYQSGDVVYLTGNITLPDGFSGEIAVLPPAARPTHYLYMLAANVPDVNSTAVAYQYVMLRIGPDGAVYVISPPGGQTSLVYLGGLSFHSLS